MKNKIFITTTLPYINSNPHVGHLFEFILGDAISRYLKIDNDVRFNVGVDEHGLKIYSKSKELGIDTQEYCDEQALLWKDFLYKFNINYDIFYRTTSEEHKKGVQHHWLNSLANGDIYKKQYGGLYCTGCESFKLEKDLVNGKCTDHNVAPTYIEEENYFFKLTKYKDYIIDWINTNSKFLLPISKLNELINIVNESEDLSISRLKKNMPWGIQVPNDEDHNMYCWYEALHNYPLAAQEYWDGYTIQIAGPDNLRWQAHVFQAFLEAEGIKKTDKLLVHGTILDGDGHKMSKSLGNTVDPIEQLEKYNIDAIRYYCLAGLNTYQNCSWNETELVNLYNSDICNDWGNLISRTLHLIDTKNVTLVKCETSFYEVIEKTVGQIHGCWINNDVNGALKKTNELVKYANKYINDMTPWNNEQYVQILSNLYELIKVVNNLYKPVFPEKCIEIQNAIQDKKKVIIFNKL